MLPTPRITTITFATLLALALPACSSSEKPGGGRTTLVKDEKGAGETTPKETPEETPKDSSSESAEAAPVHSGPFEAPTPVDMNSEAEPTGDTDTDVIQFEIEASELVWQEEYSGKDYAAAKKAANTGLDSLERMRKRKGASSRLDKLQLLWRLRVAQSDLMVQRERLTTVAAKDGPAWIAGLRAEAKKARGAAGECQGQAELKSGFEMVSSLYLRTAEDWKKANPGS